MNLTMTNWAARLRAAEHRADPHGDFATFEDVIRIGDRLLLDGVLFGRIHGDRIETPFGTGLYTPGASLTTVLTDIRALAHHATDPRVQRGVLRDLFTYRTRVVYRDTIRSEGYRHAPERIIRITDDLRRTTDVLYASRPGHLLTIHGVPVGCAPYGALVTPFGRIPSRNGKEYLYQAWCDQLQTMAQRAKKWLEEHADLSDIEHVTMRQFIQLLNESEQLDVLVRDLDEKNTYPVHEVNAYSRYWDRLNVINAHHAERSYELLDTIDGIDRKHVFGLSVDEQERAHDLRGLLAKPLTFEHLRIESGGRLTLKRQGRVHPYAELYQVEDQTHIVFNRESDTMTIPSALVVNSSEYVAYLQTKLAAAHASWCERARYDLSVYDANPYDPVAATNVFYALEMMTEWVD